MGVVGRWKFQKDVGRRTYRKISKRYLFFFKDVYFCAFFLKLSGGPLKLVGRWKYWYIIGKSSVGGHFKIFF